MTTLSVLATVSGSVGALAMFPQAYKIFKRKSAGDISILTYSVLLFVGIIWILYGIEIQNMPILITQSIAVINLLLVVLGWFLYGRSAKN